MKQPDNLMRQLFVPIVAVVGLVYTAWEMVKDMQAQGNLGNFFMWIPVAIMVLGAVFSAFMAWKRYENFQKEQAAKQPQEELPQIQAETVSLAPAGDLKDGADAFTRLITGNRGLLRQFKKATYPSTFESFCCQLEDALAYLGDEEETQTMADIVMDRLEQDWQERRRKAPDVDDQILISVYLVPALARSQDPDAMDFAEALQAAWRKRYPNSYFRIGTYEEVCKGFEKKLGCFITTAVCQSQGKADDCYELTRFRRFRDGWLANQPGGQEMIQQYYEVAPSIVNIINLQSNASDVYRQIRETYLEPCLKAIEREDNQACLKHYRDMVENLTTQYGV